MWSYLECCVLLFFWVNKEKFCILALNAYNQYEYIIIWDVNSNTGLLMHWITEVMWLTDCKLKMNNHQGLVPEIFVASKGCVHLWDTTTTQGCAAPAPGWPVALNYCFRATRNFFKKYFHRNHVLGTQDFTGLELWAPFNFSKSTALLLLKTLVYLLTGWAVD